LLPNAAAGLRAFRRMGFGLVVVTNQSGVGRRFFTAATVGGIHRRMTELLGQEGVELDGIFFCPHVPSDVCSCRKPEPGLVLEAAAKLDFDPAECVVVGDKECDVELGRRVGARTVLVKTGYGARHLADGLARPDLVAADLKEAAELIAGEIENGLFPGAVERLRRHISESIATKQRVADECEPEILAAASRIAECLRGGGKILLCGNGGSAADSQHIAAEFVSVLTQDYLRPGLPAIALTTDTSILTASANDFGFQRVFERQVQALGKPGDVVIGISTSGNSPNVLRALEYGRRNGMVTIALTGSGGGKMAGCAAIAIRVPSGVTMHIQEAHIMIGHMLCDLVERAIPEGR
jgi:phosphoheptose isomerase